MGEPGSVVPKNSGITVVKNDDNDLVPTRIQTGWRVCIDYRKLNCYNQIVIAPEDQEKTTFTCPFGTFAYRHYVESIIEVFMDDFSVYGDSFDKCLDNLALILKRCVETNLVLNWEKCHLMKDVAFDCDKEYKEAFDTLKELLTTAPIIKPPD
ncbi:uncharacterized protein LOC113295477 [Papaver somniferum]|uniref:uncharacterized protein LOC113295477 n=1 Tax=Papaver somniferum TaxID=3469 RepID=UPI000E6FB6A3|nr:uncharacterized protein LOC113295477 [Papaver somniferum]